MRIRRAVRHSLVLFLPVLLAAGGMPAAAQTQTLNTSSAEAPAFGSSAMAATAHPLASLAAVEILRQGGNAVDASVAAAFAIGVVEPDGSGLGGGGGMLIVPAAGADPVYINYYPRASSQVAGLGYTPRVDAQTAKAILVPGAVAGLTLALERYGSLPLDVVMAPAIRYAEEGFPVDATLGKIILDNVPLVQREPGTASVYLRDGFPLMEGDTLVQPELARTLRVVARSGRAGFYEGEVARKIVEGVTAAGGAMTLEDLRSYAADIRTPLTGTYRGLEIISAPPPHSGAMIIEALNILERENLRALGHYASSGEAMHLVAETLRRVYADRTAFLADPKFEDVPVQGLVAKGYAASRALDINREVADPREYRKTRAGNPSAYETAPSDASAAAPPAPTETREAWDDEEDEGRSSHHRWGDDLFGPWGKKKKQARPSGDRPPVRQADTTRRVLDPDMMEPESRLHRRGEPVPDTRGGILVAENVLERDGHTTHLGIMDKDGNVVSLTQTLGTFFGSGLTVAGVLMNNAMSNFATTVARNAIEPGKQPRSSIAPTVVRLAGRPFLSVGSPGATRIIATVVQVLVNVIDYGMSAHEANSAPRFLCQKADDFLHLESRISAEVQEDLTRRGHTLRLYGDYDLFFGGAQIILRNPVTGVLEGSADPRRGGAAIGF